MPVLLTGPLTLSAIWMPPVRGQSSPGQVKGQRSLHRFYPHACRLVLQNIGLYHVFTHAKHTGTVVNLLARSDDTSSVHEALPVSDNAVVKSERPQVRARAFHCDM